MTKASKWFAIYTAPKSEKMVSVRLEQQGIRHYLPVQKRLKQWSDRKKWVEEPVFRSYVFVNITDGEYYRVLNTSGVVKFLTFGGVAASIPERQIEMVRRLLQESAEFDVVNEKLEEGMPVEVISGPMLGTFGLLVEFRGEKRVAVKIQYLETSVLISIPARFIEPLKDPVKIELLESEGKTKFAIP